MSGKKCCLRMGMVAVIVAIVFVQITKAEGEGTKGITETQTERVLDLQVVSKETKEPISDAELGIRIMQQRSEDKTDKEGRCKIVLGENIPEYIRIEVKKEGFVPIRLAWRNVEGQPEIPDCYTLALERGTSIGGIIQNEQGKPIEGVSVYLLVPGGQEVERVAIWDHVEKTNAEGRWRCDIIPSKLDDIWIRLAHPDYISDEMYGKTPKPSIEELRAMTGVMVMKQGFTLSGRVFDVNDQPIEGASVVQGSTRFASYPSTQTDAEGQFKFENARPGEMVLTVQAKGYAPDLKQFTLYKGMETLEFRLEPGHTIRGRIVDKAGNPLAGAFVVADSWRGHRALQWRVDTDSEGQFEWNEAPSDEVLMDMGKKGYMSVRNHGMIPSEQEYEIIMPPELKISGKVADAKTGEPISDFKLLSGINWGGDRSTSWQRRSIKTFTQGHYEIEFTYPYPAHLIRIEAEGYKPGVSRAIGSDEGEVTIDFKLEKGSGPAGIVRLPDGQPAMGAEVILCTPSMGVYIYNGGNQQKRDSQYIETKEDGKFFFPVQTDVYAIVILHDKGYLYLDDSDLSESTDFTLQPWARIEGKLLIGANPGENEGIRLIFQRSEPQNNLRFNNGCKTSTDTNGNFVFDKVAPGGVRIYREIKMNERATSFSHGIALEVEAGQTYHVTIGGIGRPITGKIQVPDYMREKFSWQYADYGLRINSPENPYSQLSFKIEGDGSFRIDDVPTGDYFLYFNAYAPPSDSRSFRGDRIGLLSQQFSVPEMPNGRSDEPLDLGVLELDVIGKSDFAPSLAGKPLPAFDGIAIDFTPEKAKEKMLLVCFFDMNQRPSRHCISQLAQQAKTFEEKGGTIVAVQASKIEESSLTEWVKKNNIPFPMGRIRGDGDKIRFTWGIKSMPWLILTDRKHTVIAEGFNLSELQSKIQEADNAR